MKLKGTLSANEAGDWAKATPPARRDAVLVLGSAAVVSVSLALSPKGARAALAQDWPPFVLVAGLLLIGLVADGDGLFAILASHLARSRRRPIALFIGAALLSATVSALLNLDTAVAFLTPVFVYASRSSDDEDGVLVYATLFLANAGSPLLPGSNLTNLIVVGHLHVNGATYLAHSWLADLAAVVITTVVVGVAFAKDRHAHFPEPQAPRFRLDLGVIAVVSAVVLVVSLHDAALLVLAIGLVVFAIRLAQRRTDLVTLHSAVGPGALCGLFAVAVVFGTLGRSWSGPASLFGHLDLVATTVLGALGAVLFNNLPAASLFAARPPPHPYAFLVGLDIGPNLFVTGSLSWLLWLRAARNAGAKPSIARAVRIGVFATVFALAVSTAALVVTH